MGLLDNLKKVEDDHGLSDSDPMPFGKHKGQSMKSVPASYLMWLHENGCNNEDVSDYIAKHLDHLEDEVEETRENYGYDAQDPWGTKHY